VRFITPKAGGETVLQLARGILRSGATAKVTQMLLLLTEENCPAKMQAGKAICIVIYEKFAIKMLNLMSGVFEIDCSGVSAF
jgi:hypothetical protein